MMERYEIVCYSIIRRDKLLNHRDFIIFTSITNKRQIIELILQDFD